MTSQETAVAFTALLSEGRHRDAAERFNADDIVSIEAMDGPMAVLTGKAAVKGKADWWFGAFEVHAGTATGPFVHGDEFIVHFTMDVTERATGKRSDMSEVGVYTVRDGKIVREKFYYTVD